MPVICPTVLATSKQDFDEQLHKVAAFAHRVQLDTADGIFAPNKTLGAEQLWWPAGVKADIHIMYQKPFEIVDDLLKHRPHLLICHAEAQGNFAEFAADCKVRGVKVGVALLKPTSPEAIAKMLNYIDHVLIFSGDLGHFGGQADLSLLEKVRWLKAQKPNLEIGWDGGINDQNVSELIFGGVDVLNVGGFIQKAADPAKAYEALERIADETGTT